MLRFTIPRGPTPSAARLAPLLALAGLMLMLVACGRATAETQGREEATATATPGAETLRVESGRLERRLVLSGELVAEVAAPAIAPNVGVWPLQVRWVGEHGAEVAAGAPVIELDNAQVTAELEEERTRLVEARNEVATKRAQAASQAARDLLEVERKRAALAKARIDADVPAELSSEKLRAERQRDLRRAELEVREAEVRLAAGRQAAAADVAIAELGLAQAESSLVRNETAIDELVLRAPRAGVLVLADSLDRARPLQTGDQVWPGMVLARIPELPSLVVEARLFDVDDGELAPGLAARATLDAFPERTYEGTVRTIDAMAQPTAGDSPRRAFRVVVDLASLDLERMRPGMSVKLDVTLPGLDDVVTAPRAALLWRGDKPLLQMADGARRPVRLGTCSTARCVLFDGPPAGTLLAAARDVGDDEGAS